MNRTSGILLHPISLPGPYGIGDMGSEAQRFVDFLADAGQGLWQVLPLGPTGYGDSPYQCLSAFAGNPLLISPELLLQDGWLSQEDLADAPHFSEDSIDYGSVIPWKRHLLERAYERFRDGANAGERSQFAAFCAQHNSWLEDYCLFIALKENHGGALWSDWEPELAKRDPAALRHWRIELGKTVVVHQFGQYQFFRQWTALRHYAHERGVRMVGDIPIFVAHDSADVWTHPEWFHVDENGKLTLVAGVPPDYFSSTGQRWGNPLYRWEMMAADGYSFWVERLRTVLSLVDWVRLDHFRGFAACWEIPASHSTAEHGRWVAGPGLDLFNAVKKALDGLPVIAEDLGLITWDVEALRERLQLPGMAVLQFAFGADMDGTGKGTINLGDSPFLPHNHRRDMVVYTGTHDNDTLLGWWRTAPEGERQFALNYLGSDGQHINWDMIRACLASVANWAIIPFQDTLDLGSEARLNTPGQAGGNWTWRYRNDVLTPELAARLRQLSSQYGRRPAPRIPL